MTIPAREQAMPIFFFHVKVSPTSATELKEVAAPDFLRAIQPLATWHPGIHIHLPSFQAFSYAISGFTRLWLLIRSPILLNRAAESPALQGNGEARRWERRLEESGYRVAGRPKEAGRLRRVPGVGSE